MKCKRCNGMGTVYDPKKNESVACPNCGGTGKAEDAVRH